jgi:hypothetical protein
VLLLLWKLPRQLQERLLLTLLQPAQTLRAPQLQDVASAPQLAPAESFQPLQGALFPLHLLFVMPLRT